MCIHCASAIIHASLLLGQPMQKRVNKLPFKANTDLAQVLASLFAHSKIKMKQFRTVQIFLPDCRLIVRQNFNLKHNCMTLSFILSVCMILSTIFELRVQRLKNRVIIIVT